LEVNAELDKKNGFFSVTTRAWALTTLTTSAAIRRPAPRGVRAGTVMACEAFAAAEFDVGRHDARNRGYRADYAGNSWRRKLSMAFLIHVSPFVGRLRSHAFGRPLLTTARPMEDTITTSVASNIRLATPPTFAATCSQYGPTSLGGDCSRIAPSRQVSLQTGDCPLVGARNPGWPVSIPSWLRCQAAAPDICRWRLRGAGPGNPL
jgi:hypothetical protein